MTELAGVMKKLDEFGNVVKHIQDTNDRLKKSYDGLDVENIKTTTELALKAMDRIQALEQKDNAEEHSLRMDALELAVAKGSASDASVEEKEYKNSITLYMRRGIPMAKEVVEAVCSKQIEASMIGMDEDYKAVHKKDMVAAVGPSGGYFILPDRSNKISTRIFETSPIRTVANMETTTSDMFQIILDDDVGTVGHVGETETRTTTTTADIGQVDIPIHEIYAQPKATQKMIDDAGFDIEAWHTKKTSKLIGRQENTDYTIGNGSKKAKGFMTYAAWDTAGTYQRNAVERITATGTAATLDEGNDLILLQNALNEEYQLSSAFGMKRATFGDVMTLVDASGRYLMNPYIIKEGTDKILLGSPVVFMNDMPAVGAGTLPVICADFSEFYTIVDRFGIRIIRDEVTVKGYVLYYTTKRSGGAVTNYEAGKILLINS